MDQEDQSYVCTLDKASVWKAKEELNETPEDRLHAVKAFRDWIKQQPHIRCPKTDTKTLLMILRSAKFSQLRAREMLEGNLSLKYEAPEWFMDINTNENKILEILETGYTVILPKRTRDGCAVNLLRLASINLKKFSIDDVMRTTMVTGYYLSQSEMTQVNGTVFIVDCTGLTSSHLTAMLDRKSLGKWYKMWQKNIPGRFKAFHYYNAGLFFEAMMAFSRPLLSKKFQERIMVHDNLESLYKSIPMDVLPEEYLPDDYEGLTSGSLQEIIRNQKNNMLKEDFRKDLLYSSSKAFGIEKEKKPSKTENVTQYFRKLNVD